MLNHLWAWNLSCRTPMYGLQWLKTAHQMVRGRGNGRGLRLQEDSFGSRGPTNRNPSGFFCGHRVMIKLLTRGQLAVLGKRGQRVLEGATADVWLQNDKALRGKPDVGFPCSVNEIRYVCAQQMYSWPFGDGLKQSRPRMEARDYKPSEQKGVAWVPWDVLSSGEKDDLLPAISLLRLMDHVWS